MFNNFLAPPPQRYFHGVEVDRIPMIGQRFGNRPAEVPQSFYDFTAADAANPNTHPHVGPFSHNAVRDGYWSDPFTWDTVTLPDDNAVVNVGSYKVEYDRNAGAHIKDIHVGGRGWLKWTTAMPTLMYADTIVCHGIFTMGDGESQIGENPTYGAPMAEIVFWQSEAPGATARLGINTMGPVRAMSVPKAHRLYAVKDIKAGQNYVRLNQLDGSGWRKGDEIVLVATDNAGTSATDPQYTGPTQFYGPYENVNAVRTRTLGYRKSHDEVFTIQAIVGDIVVLDGTVQYDHVVTMGTLKQGQRRIQLPRVCNLSRPIRMRSLDPSSLQTRAHTMFMHHDDVDIRGIDFLNMARTDTNPSLAQPDGTLAYATNGGALITDANNVRGRYAGHLHVNGAYFGRKQCVIADCVFRAAFDQPPMPGWGLTHHGARAALERNITLNTRGAGIVSELGTEIGQWIDNESLYNRGDGFPVSWGSRAELWQNHNGHAGVAYECQARQILMQGNGCSSSNFGWLYMQQNVYQSTRVPDANSLRLVDPLDNGKGSSSSDPQFSLDEYTYGIENAQIPDFHENTGFGIGVNFFVSHRQFTERRDMTPMIARGFDSIACETAFQVKNYSFHYSFYDSMWTAATQGQGKGASLGEVAWKMNLVNILMRGFAVGVANDGIGFNFDGWNVDLKFENVTKEGDDFLGDFDTTAWEEANPGKTWPQDFAYYNLMGPWETTTQVAGHWTGKLRKFRNLDSLTDLPQPYASSPRGLGGVEPSPGTPIPYWYIDPASDLSLGTDGVVSIYGAVVDHIGVRRYPDEFSSEGFGPSTVFDGTLWMRVYGNLIPDLIKRNGCFLDTDGKWKVPCWLKDHDRLTGQYMMNRVDLLLATGTDAALLAANTVDPSIPPDLPLRRESIGLKSRPIVIDTTPPPITSPANIFVDEGVILRHLLKAAEIHPSWSITGGADASRFELAVASGVSVLRWVGNGVADYEGTTDADANNVYEVQVTVTNPMGYSNSQTIYATVRNKNDAVNAAFADNFNRSTENVEASPNWSRIGGRDGQAAVVSNVVAGFIYDTPRAAYVSPDTGSGNHYAQGTLFNSNTIHLALSITDENNYIGLNHNNSSLELVQCVGGVTTILATYSGASNSAVNRLEYSGGVLSTYINGTLKGSITPPSPPPATSRAGFVPITMGSALDNFASGAV